MAQGKRAGGTSGFSVATLHRPGWVTFAAVASFVVGVYYVLIALSEFANSYWIYSNIPSHVYSLAGSHLFWWGIFDSIIAAISIVAGFSLLRGGFYGLIIALTGAGFSALRWLFYIPAEPWLAITIIAIDILVIYGLCVSMDYFADTADMGSV